MSEEFQLKRHRLDFFQVDPMPSEEELEAFYSDRYYQESLGGYRRTYDEAELEYRRSEVLTCLKTLDKKLGVSGCHRALDLGCGEGFFSKYLSEAGWDVECVDYSISGIKNANPELLGHFTRSNLVDYLDAFSEVSDFRLINLDNVLEHSRQPELLLKSIYKIMSDDSVLRIEVPNDFSSFQNYLVAEGLTRQSWFNPPEHLNYFGPDSLISLVSECGFRVVSLQCDFPIELFLLNCHSNYTENAGRGKEAHRSRIRAVNFLTNENIDAFVDYQEAAAKLHYGRQVTAYVVKDRHGV